MKKVIALILLLLIIAPPCYALNIIDKFLYKKDVVRANNTPVLVNRLTGEIKYLYRSDGQLLPVDGQWKEQYQKMYDAQGSGQKK